MTFTMKTIGKHGHDWNVKVKLGRQSNCGLTLLKQSASKVVLIIESNERPNNM